MERALYPLISPALMECFGAVGKHNICIESTHRGFSEPIKAAFRRDRDIEFSFFDRTRPDQPDTSTKQLAKKYCLSKSKTRRWSYRTSIKLNGTRSLLVARYAFVISSQRIPEKLKRLCNSTPAILNSFGDYQAFLVLAHFADGNCSTGFPRSFSKRAPATGASAAQIPRQVQNSSRQIDEPEHHSTDNL
jgi:hypothetical protein